MFRWVGEELSNEDGSIYETFGGGIWVVKLLCRTQKSGDCGNAICLMCISSLRYHCKIIDSHEPLSKEDVGMQYPTKLQHGPDVFLLQKHSRTNLDVPDRVPMAAEGTISLRGR